MRLQELKRSAGLISLVVANIFPAVGILFWHWNPGNILILYWLENLAIGGWTVAKILTAGAPSELDAVLRRPDLILLSKLGFACFFCCHYGIFTAVHGVFVFSFAHTIGVSGSRWYWFITWLGLFISHGVSFATNWWPRERFTTAPNVAMTQPYGRVLVLHFAILGGAFLLIQFKAESALPALLLLAIKTIADVAFYRRSHAG